MAERLWGAGGRAQGELAHGDSEEPGSDVLRGKQAIADP